MAKIMNMGILLLLVVASLGLIPCTTEAAEHTVEWIIPNQSSYYQNFVAINTFRVNDVLVFNFTTGFHNVARLTKKNFEDCNVNDHLKLEPSGPAKIKLDSAGEYYFACLFPRHCTLGQKLSINVTGSSSSSSSSSPAPSSPPPSSPASPMSVSATLSFLLMAIAFNVCF